VVIEKQAKISVVVCGFKKLKRAPKILVQQRLKQPFYGFWGFATGKVRWGETTFEAAARELEEETGLTAKLSLSGIEHKMDYSKNRELLEDKYFFIIKATETKGKLKKKIKGGRNLWLTEKEIVKLPSLFPDVMEIIKVLEQDKLVFWEEKYTASSY
jgi:8-oxo-dGTP pyrophosphatase MutT (NUDIX family)